MSTECLRVAVSQFAASTAWEDNARTCTRLVGEADTGGADLLVLPEGVLARFTDDFTRIRSAAQPLDGPFVTALRDATAGRAVTVVAGVHEPAADGRAHNTLVALRDGQLIAAYRKLHLYDAFTARESDNVAPGDALPPLVDCNGFQVGLMTCYDVRFPEHARLLALAGADLLVLPAAWVRGPLKEWHWRLNVSARALENTVYVAAAGECGPRNIGQSIVVDPLGVAVAAAAEGPTTIWADVRRDRIAAARRALPVLGHRRFAVDPQPRPHDLDPATETPASATSVR
jgi:predicted amidohydrolase